VVRAALRPFLELAAQTQRILGCPPRRSRRIRPESLPRSANSRAASSTAS